MGFWGGSLERVKARATAEHFMKGGAEVAEAVVADGKGGLGDVALAGAQKFGGALETEAAEILLHGDAGFLREKAAEIGWAAIDHLAEFLEGGRFGEAFLEDDLRPANAVAGQALGAGAEEFAAGRAEEEVGGDFQGFAAKPDFVGGGENRAVAQALDQLLERGDEAFGRGNFGGASFAGDDGLDEGMQLAGVRLEVLAKEGWGEFDGDEAVGLAGGAGGLKGRLALVIESEGLRGEARRRRREWRERRRHRG